MMFGSEQFVRVSAAVAGLGLLAACAGGDVGSSQVAGALDGPVVGGDDLTLPPPERPEVVDRASLGVVQPAVYTGPPPNLDGALHSLDLRRDGAWDVGVSGRSNGAAAEVSRRPPPDGWRLAQADAEPAEGATGGDEVDLAAANQAFANPLAQATLAIVEYDRVTLGGDLSDGNRTTNVAVIEPLIPVPLGDSGWSLVNRPILPIGIGADVPVAGGGGGPTADDRSTGVAFDGKNGLGDFTFFSLLTPVTGDSPFKWGIGPIFRFPTATNDKLGSEKYSVGPAAVALYSSESFSIGALNQNLFSFAGEDDRDDVRVSTLQYFAFYNFTPEWGVGTAPIISVDWDEASNADGYAVPVGLGVTRTFRIGEIPTRMLVEGQYYVVQRDSFGPEWNVRVALAMFFPLLF